MGFLILRSRCHPAQEDLPTGANSDLQTYWRVTKAHETHITEWKFRGMWFYPGGGLILTCCIQSVESRNSIAIEHPEMAVVTGKQAGFTGGHNMIAHNVTTVRGRREGERIKKKCLSALYWRHFWKVLTPLVGVYYLTDVCFCPVYNNKGLGIQKRLHTASL